MLWTPSTFAHAGMLVSDTETPGRAYQISSEHHVHNEIEVRNAAHWSFYALQTEEEWGEGEKCLPLDIINCTNLTFANTILFRVFGITDPFADGARIAIAGNSVGGNMTAAITLMALLGVGDAGTIGFASAAKMITVPRQTKFVPARAQRADRQDRGYGPYDRGYDGAWTYYYGRPYFYAPAPFPLGFDFGFGW